ncbi:MAG: DeoR/GlpR family DNA-binding transcription regulator [Lachnospiraceae bacterium]|nr:DeoR/GlpR family DNA-binding transcription regulator [Lachnospiraceae bacterium]
MGKRNVKILDLLMKYEKMDVAHMAEELGVSQVTVRKDLDEMEAMGLLTREHGYAMLKKVDGMEGRIAYHYEEKCRIARRAADLVDDGGILTGGSCVMIENGSTCALLAEELTQKCRNLTIVTNSMYVAEYIRAKSSFQVILLGGIVNPQNMAMVGPMVKSCVENFCVDYLFMGVNGYSPEFGFTKEDQMCAQALRDMATRANKVVILSYSGKFAKTGFVPIGLDPKDCIVITDDEVKPEIADGMRAQGMEVILA